MIVPPCRSIASIADLEALLTSIVTFDLNQVVPY